MSYRDKNSYYTADRDRPNSIYDQLPYDRLYYRKEEGGGGGGGSGNKLSDRQGFFYEDEDPRNLLDYYSRSRQYDGDSASLVGSPSGSGGGKYVDCCPLVVDPLTLLSLIAGIAAATAFLNVAITMNIVGKKRKKRSGDVDSEGGEQQEGSFSRILTQGNVIKVHEHWPGLT